MALKASKKHCSSDEEEPEDNDEEAFSLIVRGLNKVGLRKKFNHKSFNQKGSTFKRNEKGKSYNKNETNVSACYGCGVPGHMLKDCPLLQKVGERRKFKRKKNKKAMIAAESDSESSESDNYEEHVVNTCLMAKKKSNLNMEALMR